MQQAYTAPSQLSNADFLRWSQGAENPNFGGDAGGFNMNNFGGSAGLSQPQYDSSLPTPSTQLARRPLNRQLVPTAQRSTYDNSVDPWGQFGDEPMMDQPGSNGAMEDSDSIERLEEKAAVAKREAQSKRKQIPPFVQKLSSFLDESKNTDLIRWSDRGDSFIVLDEDEFAKTLIPELFKHNNYASFVRQLNMYGFHKRVGLSDNSMKASERKNKSPSEYYNPYFKQGHPNLLWLINKAKGGSSKSQKKRVKNEDGHADVDSDDDGKDVEETFYGNTQGSRALSTAPESGPLQRRDVAVIQGQLADIQKQFGAMSQAIARLRKEHNQLYQQAIAFQTLHDRHESSINAILTFLANVYNRGLDGQVPQNFAQMFANAIPQDQQRQHQGNVVDIGEVGGQTSQNASTVSPPRRQRLLMAPPASGSRSGKSTSASSTPQTQSHANMPHSGSVEELLEGNANDSPQVKTEEQQEMMDLINNTNARTPPNSGGVQFPEILSEYTNAPGQSPMSPELRNAMLNIIANQGSVPGSNNALVSPSPPPGLDLQNLAYSQAEIDELARMNANNEARIREVSDAVGPPPFSPSGSLGLNENSYFPALDSDHNSSNLDLDQYLDPGAFYNGSSPLTGAGGLDMDNYDGFDLGMDGANETGRIVETNSSGAPTPEAEANEEKVNDMRSSPNKRRRT